MIQVKESKLRDSPFHTSPPLACCYPALLKMSGMSPPERYTTNFNISIALTDAEKVSNSCGKKSPPQGKLCNLRSYVKQNKSLNSLISDLLKGKCIEIE